MAIRIASLIEADVEKELKNAVQVWFHRKNAPMYALRHGCYNITPNSIDYAVETGRLHKPKKIGNKNFWHKDWLDEWLGAESKSVEKKEVSA